MSSKPLFGSSRLLVAGPTRSMPRREEKGGRGAPNHVFCMMPIGCQTVMIGMPQRLSGRYTPWTTPTTFACWR
jgi:hypothetical protein